MSTKPVGIYVSLTEADGDALGRLAKVEGCTRQDVVRRALHTQLQPEEEICALVVELEQVRRQAEQMRAQLADLRDQEVRIVDHLIGRLGIPDHVGLELDTGVTDA